MVANARKYIKLCSSSIKDLKEKIPYEAKIERMLLSYCKANYYEAKTEFRKAKKYALETLRLATELKQETYITKSLMFLFYTNMKLQYKDDAFEYIWKLFPLSQYVEGRFARNYKRFLKMYEPVIKDHIQEEL